MRAAVFPLGGILNVWCCYRRPQLEIVFIEKMGIGHLRHIFMLSWGMYMGGYPKKVDFGKPPIHFGALPKAAAWPSGSGIGNVNQDA